MKFNQPHADKKIWGLWDKDWDSKLAEAPGNTAFVTEFLLELAENHSDLLDPSKKPDEQYEDLKSMLTTSGRLYKYSRKD
jgi:hypothetical protein